LFDCPAQPARFCESFAFDYERGAPVANEEVSARADAAERMLDTRLRKPTSEQGFSSAFQVTNGQHGMSILFNLFIWSSGIK